MNNVETLLVVWQDEQSRSYYHIGTLSYYNGLYEFTYTSEDHKKQLGDALKKGYMIHPAFPDTTKLYRSKKLFPAFDRRIPSIDRKDFTEILADLGLNKNASKMDILRITRGRLASDTYSFEQPLRLGENNMLDSSFFIHGMRHRNLPNEWSSWIQEHSVLNLVQEPGNEHDSYAVAIYTKGGKHLGYVPSFYSNAVFSLIENGLTPIIQVANVNEKSHPHWWVQVEFKCAVPLDQEEQVEELLAVI
ncbi:MULTISPECIES: HIRAN domain-containing protein [unclassified Sporosarcina]|uniref:HIRAN domain-containing protein n=1 Tax=unclassified Sporosarcina TaxID=2647733 RepID=UPI0020403E85|nr:MULTISPECIES: HIRAN domain-containing protein [unclassified Sporosarcina]GKV65900.1 hypothetical protein NCCP2331_20530 [Sporosarcina sp. NCCP-2331]GLB56100.1 hypothetical protein NCCP2378_18870 [Sporosarcina sp. NCCP-2378]